MSRIKLTLLFFVSIVNLPAVAYSATEPNGSIKCESLLESKANESIIKFNEDILSREQAIEYLQNFFNSADNWHLRSDVVGKKVEITSMIGGMSRIQRQEIPKGSVLSMSFIQMLDGPVFALNLIFESNDSYDPLTIHLAHSHINGQASSFESAIASKLAEWHEGDDENKSLMESKLSQHHALHDRIKIYGKENILGIEIKIFPLEHVKYHKILDIRFYKKNNRIHSADISLLRFSLRDKFYQHISYKMKIISSIHFTHP